MNTKKMIHSILLFGIFWYLYLGYLLQFEMQLEPIFLVLLTLLLGIFLLLLHPLCNHIAGHRKKVNSHEL